MGQTRHGPTPSNPVSNTDPLTPFVGELRQRLSSELHAWLKVPVGCDVDFRVLPQGVDVRLQHRGDAFQLELRSPALSEAGAWVLGGSSLRIWRGTPRTSGGNSPVLLTLLKELLQRRADGSLDPSALLAAVAAYRPFRGASTIAPIATWSS
jgi:hypothetical protein